MRGVVFLGRGLGGNCPDIGTIHDGRAWYSLAGGHSLMEHKRAGCMNGSDAGKGHKKSPAFEVMRGWFFVFPLLVFFYFLAVSTRLLTIRALVSWTVLPKRSDSAVTICMISLILSACVLPISGRITASGFSPDSVAT